MGFSLTEDEEDKLAAKRAAYLSYLEKMTAQTAGLGAKYFAKDVRYQGPFLDVYGRAPVVEHFMERFSRMPDYRLKLRTSFMEDSVLYLRWDVAGTHKGKSKIVSGMSEVTFDLQGLVCSHIDYYDPVRSFLFDVPFIGAWLKGLYKTVK